MGETTAEGPTAQERARWEELLDLSDEEFDTLEPQPGETALFVVEAVRRRAVKEKRIPASQQYPSWSRKASA